MAYATAPRFIQAFGLEETAQLLSDEEGLVTGLLLQGAISVAAGGYWPCEPEPTEPEIEANTRALERLQRVLDTRSNFMDGYLRGAVALPLTPLDANAGTLEQCCLDLTRCGLSDDTDNATERMDKCCAQWCVWLKDVARGTVQLVGAGGQPVATNTSTGARSGQAVTGYDWGRFGRNVVGRSTWRPL